MHCNGIVPVALLSVSLMLMKFLTQITFKKKEAHMEHVIVKPNNVKVAIKSIIETSWAIGTSVAAACVLSLLSTQRRKITCN
jgi:hypothetical protein